MSGATGPGIRLPEAAIQPRQKLERARTRGRGVSAFSRCMNSSGDITKSVVQSRRAIFNFRTTWPAAASCKPTILQSGRSGACPLTHQRQAARLRLRR